MEKIKFYGAGFWGGCAPVKEYLSEKGIDYDYIDISETEENKEEFYKLREQYEEYSEIVEEGARFGIPALFYDNEVIIGFDKEKIDELIKKLA